MDTVSPEGPAPAARALAAHPAGVLGLVASCIAWLDKPWKGFALGLLLTLGTVLFIAYDQRVVLVTGLIASPDVEMSIDAGRAPGVLVELLRQTGGAVAFVSDWDVERNRRTTILAMNKAGRRMELVPRSLPIVRSPRLPSIVLPALLAGEVPCVDVPPAPPDGQVDRVPPDVRSVASAEGLHAYCISGIPSGLGALLGAVTVLFERRPADEAAVAVALRAAANDLLRLEPRRGGS